MRVLVCGARDFTIESAVWGLLSDFLQVAKVEVLIHGGAPGVDTIAGQWANERGIPVEVFPADWDASGRAAGPIRNQRMIDEGKPDVVFAINGGRGTADMLRRARRAGIPSIVERYGCA